MPLYNSAKKDFLTGAISVSADAAAGLLHAILLSASYSGDIDSHTRYRDISAAEISVAHPAFAQGYFANGLSLSASNVFAQDDSNDRGSWDSADVTWTSSTITARYLAIVKVRNGGLDKENDNLIGYIDLGSDQSSSNGSFSIQWSANGIILFT
jgi:hypothetical protein